MSQANERRARELLGDPPGDPLGNLQWSYRVAHITAALDGAEARGLERAAVLTEGFAGFCQLDGAPPSTVASAEGLATRIRALKPPTPTTEPLEDGPDLMNEGDR